MRTPSLKSNTLRKTPNKNQRVSERNKQHYHHTGISKRKQTTPITPGLKSAIMSMGRFGSAVFGWMPGTMPKKPSGENVAPSGPIVRDRKRTMSQSGDIPDLPGTVATDEPDIPDRKRRKIMEDDQVVPPPPGSTGLTGCTQWRSVVQDGTLSQTTGFGQEVEQFVLQGVPANMNIWEPPVVKNNNTGITALVILGITYQQVTYTDTNSEHKIHKLNGAKGDTRLFFEQYKGVVGLIIVCLTDFLVETKKLMQEFFNGRSCFYFPPTIEGLEKVFTLFLPNVENITRTVVHISCHGVPGGFLVLNHDDKPTHATIMLNIDFTKLLQRYGQNRKVSWKKDNGVCNPLQLTVYLDRCHAGDTLPMKWVFGIKSTIIERIVDQNTDMSVYESTRPEICHMHIVCLSACPPANRTSESTRYMGFYNNPCGLFSYLMHSPTKSRSKRNVTLNELIYGWNTFNAHTFSMVPLIWFYMDKQVVDRTQAGFFWSTNVECPGTDSLCLPMAASVHF
jgi:hypothetical protein